MNQDPVKIQHSVHIGGAQIHLQNVRLREDVLLDEVHLEGEDVHLESPTRPGESGTITTGETRVRIVVSEPNLNRILADNIPEDAPVRSLRISVLSGRLKITGNFIKSVMSLPFTVEATPKIENGIYVTYEFHSAKMGVGLPAAVVDVIQNIINERLMLDMSKSPIPIWLDEIRCEPGRISVLGKIRIQWPPASTAKLSPF